MLERDEFIPLKALKRELFIQPPINLQASLFGQKRHFTSYRFAVAAELFCDASLGGAGGDIRLYQGI